MVKSSTQNTPGTWLIFLCLRTHASRQTCHHFASSVLAVRITEVAALSQCICSESPCGGRHWLAHPLSQDILSSIHHNLINSQTTVKNASDNCKVVSMCDAGRSSSKQAAGFRDYTYAEKWCCVQKWRTQEFCWGGVSTNSVEDRGQRERGSGGGSPLVRGSGGSCNFVQEISFRIVQFS